mmetsp:Transcript_69758/g.167469  ORF Transcript_69758/g.167469 Transcript_69758/m.167469 type:complete len:209 (+) Transcript_69758:65-691(+)|eukprot:CAMPEP_0178421916 /NCGR_PEP_ID=MMETSP0689_2-20121128/26898_1 /TAXON_ID=160604 /ORGANISM="Amphidinium massartii, Strain CS-259" /LENGTH=208 /DNA_ID=CAMNT_0020043451 /DNA_START=58 /DNA_END=684 /DNA_ORIENTATION=-
MMKTNAPRGRSGRASALLKLSLLLAVITFTASALGLAFAGVPVAVPPRAASPVRRLAAAASDPLSVQLQADHGEKWQAVANVLKGGVAKSAEEMLRARLAAVRAQDPVFLARTEDLGKEFSLEDKAKFWAQSFGLAKRNLWDSVFADKKHESLQSIARMEILDAAGDEVEFKVWCEDGTLLHARSIFKKDPKFGFVSNGKNVFEDWTN